MKNFIQPGEVLDITAPYAVTSGGGVKAGAIIGIAVNNMAQGDVGPVNRRGVYNVAKANETWVQGEKIYWDDAAKVFTKVANANTLCGTATAAVAVAGTLVGPVLLDGAIR